MAMPLFLPLFPAHILLRAFSLDFSPAAFTLPTAPAFWVPLFVGPPVSSESGSLDTGVTFGLTLCAVRNHVFS